MVLATFSDLAHCTENKSLDLSLLTNVGSLNRHMKTAHDIGPELTCAYCDFNTRREDNLKNHIRIEHEGVRYNCESCKFIAKCPQYLNLHKKVVHEGFRYKCDQCDSKATQIGQLYAHRKKMHGLTDNSGIKLKHKTFDGIIAN